ncbi:hypothetical protein AAC387_Pa10g0297 [Persea americana]
MVSATTRMTIVKPSDDLSMEWIISSMLEFLLRGFVRHELVSMLEDWSLQPPSRSVKPTSESACNGHKLVAPDLVDW